MSRLRLKQIKEILLTNPQNGDYLAYNNATGQWENLAAPLDGTSGSSGSSGTSGSSGSSGSDGSSGTSGSILNIISLYLWP